MYSKTEASCDLQLRQAAAKGVLSDVQALVEQQGANINAQGPSSGKTALHQAASKGHVPIVKYLLSKGAQLIKDNDNKTAYDYASDEIKIILTQKFKVVETAMSSDRLFSYPEHYNMGSSALSMCLAYKINTMTLADFIALMEKYEHPAYTQGMPVLSIVAIKDESWFSSGKIDYLLGKGFDPNLKAMPEQLNFFEGTALHGLLANERVDEAMQFLKLVKSKNIVLKTQLQDKFGKTYIHMAVILKRRDFIELLIKNFGAQALNIQDMHQRTPLHYAYLLGAADIVPLLHKHGALDDIMDDKQRYPVHMLEASSEEIKTVLQDFHLDPQRRGKKKTLFKECIIGIKELRGSLSSSVSFRP